MVFGKLARDAVIAALKSSYTINSYVYDLDKFEEDSKVQLDNLASTLSLSYKWISDESIFEETISDKKYFIIVLSLHLYCEADDNLFAEEKSIDIMKDLIDDIYTNMPSVLVNHSAKLLKIGPVTDLSTVESYEEQAHLHTDVQIYYKD